MRLDFAQFQRRSDVQQRFASLARATRAIFGAFFVAALIFIVVKQPPTEDGGNVGHGVTVPVALDAFAGSQPPTFGGFAEPVRSEASAAMPLPASASQAIEPELLRLDRAVEHHG